MLSSSSTSFREPRKAILSTADLATFQQHASYKLITDFLEKLNDSVKNCRLSQGDDKGSGGQYSDAIQRLVTLLNTLQSWINEYPPVENGKSRFGNPSFRVRN